MRIVVVILTVCCSLGNLYAQKENDNWIKEILLTFDRGDGRVVEIPAEIAGSEGGASISDKDTGKLLMYTNGIALLDAEHDPVDNTFSLLSGISSTQGALFVPVPNRTMEFYLFTVPDLSGFEVKTTGAMYYSRIKQTPSGWSVAEKNVLMIDSVAEKLTGTIDCSGKGFWIVAHHRRKNEFYTFHVTEFGVKPQPTVSRYSTTRAFDHTAGQIKISPNNKFLALASTSGLAAVFDFDQYTGLIQNIKPLLTKEYCYGTAFSANSKKLYFGLLEESGSLIQYDLGTNTLPAILGSKSIVHPRDHFGLQLGPDKKLYCSITAGASVVDYPDADALKCGFSYDKLRLGLGWSSFPNMMDYNLTSIDNSIDFSDSVLTICQGEGIRIGLRRSNPVHQYSWTLDGSSSGIVQPNNYYIEAAPKKNSIYLLTVEDTNASCFVDRFSYKRYVVNVKNTPTISVQADTVVVCAGNPAQLFAKGGTHYRWNPTEGLSNATIANPICTATRNIRYTVTSAIGDCADSAHVNVIALAATKADAGLDKYICGKDSATIGTPAEFGVSYRWTPETGLNNPFIAQPTASPTTTTSYLLRTSVGNNCIQYDGVTVVVGTVVPRISNDTAICSGNPAQLSAAGGNEFLWSPTTGLSNPNIRNPIAIPLTTTRYTVYISSGTCRDSASTTIVVKNSPTAYAGTDKAICKGLSVQLGSEDNPQYSYSWSPTDYLNNTTTGRPFCTPPKTMRYVLTAKNDVGCVAYDTVDVTVGGELSIVVSKDTSVCVGKSMQLFAGGADSYVWRPAAGLDNPNIANPVATPTSTTRYYVTGSRSGCTGVDSVLITVYSQPEFQVSNDTVICEGTSVQLLAVGAGNYTWRPTAGLDDATIFNPVASPTTTTTYYVEARNGYCTTLDSVTVSVNAKPNLNVSNDTSICEGTSVQLLASGAQSYLWTPTTGLNNSAISNPIATPAKTTKYYVEARNGYCTTLDSVTVSVNAKPNLNVSNDTSICAGVSVQLSASGAQRYLWTPTTGLSNPNIANPIARPPFTTVYTVQGTTDNCTATQSTTIVVNDASTKFFELSAAQTTKYAPGEYAAITVNIPTGLRSAEFSVQYEDCCVLFDNILSANIAAHTTSVNGGIARFSIDNPTKLDAEIVLNFRVLLPPDARLTEKFTLQDIRIPESCNEVEGDNVQIQYDASCVWSIRGVKTYGKFDLRADGETATYFSGFGGHVVFALYDITGQQLWNHAETFAPSIQQTFALPNVSQGIYILRAQCGTWRKDIPIIK